MSKIHNEQGRIALVGDFSPKVRAHVAIPEALKQAADSAGANISHEWIHTTRLDRSLANLLREFEGLWCVPASPYANMTGVLEAIRFAREAPLPFLGTCGGFQHALIEYARNVRNLPLADHEESNPTAGLALISKLSCSLVGAKGRIRFAQPSRSAMIYGSAESTEEYHCNYGLNPKLESLLDGGQLKITGTDEAGQARVVELEGHPYFFGTLFQPELSALEARTHPLIVSFVRAVAEHSKRQSG